MLRTWPRMRNGTKDKTGGDQDMYGGHPEKTGGGVDRVAAKPYPDGMA